MPMVVTMILERKEPSPKPQPGLKQESKGREERKPGSNFT